jgi:hypothetical protein
MERITIRDLEAQVEILNNHFDGRAAAAGVYSIGGAYGGWRLEHTSIERGETVTRTSLGGGRYYPKRALLGLLFAFRYGIEAEGRGR